ncbi:LANO_0A06172g1_1 [Lachancea nothofagi CBS 11611]|uniref:RING-type E3 ubiquitin transferase n=1 Tax=Lachancea nothofagi CBS 11611 TaxID=1266666 RepID=A0A1G4IRX6_9SACH|nr:LANO_0A06172g1_1 [Lachancea nothofagi CBS 11611]
MVVHRIRKSQFAAYTLATYVGAIWSVFTCAQSSMSFLEASMKLCEGINVIILANFVLINTILLWKGLTKLLFGELRLLEYEHILERLSFTIVNSFFVTSTFSDNEFLTVLLFTGALIFVKVFHWVLRDRLEYVFQNTDENTRILKLMCSKFFFNICFLALVDYKAVNFCIRKSMRNSSGILSSSPIYLMFGIEFAILLVDVCEVALRSLINIVELRAFQNAYSRNGDDSPGLEGKFLYEKIVEFSSRFAKLCLHALLLIPFAMPLMAMKDIVLDILAICQTGRLIWKSWKNNRQIDEKLPNVSEAELDTSDDKMCIVCMDDMIPADRVAHPKQKPKRLPCNHCLHLGCLKSWMERSQTCPICRVAVFDEKGNVAAPSRSQSNTQGPNMGPTMDASASSSTAAGQNGSSGSAAASTSSHSNISSVPPRWYAFSATPSQKDDSVDLKVSDIEGNALRMTLTHKRRPEFDVQNKASQIPQKIVIQDCSFNNNHDIERFKRRVSDLEGKVNELTKKARTE